MHETSTAPEKSRLLPLALAALGVVYGDIGTSPLYAMRECFFGQHGVEANRGNVLGVLSLIFWTLIVVVTLKYHVYVLRADNRGEGGILALMALVRSKVRRLDVAAGWWPLGLFGAALLYGDGMMTPAISVLGRGRRALRSCSPRFGRLVVPMTHRDPDRPLLFQRRGTARGRLGLRTGHAGLVRHARGAGRRRHRCATPPCSAPSIRSTRSRFLAEGGGAGFLVLGAIFLVATGGEALYADLGHFGEKPIQIDWFAWSCCPVCCSTTSGRARCCSRDAGAAENPFYRLAPDWALCPLLALATMAAIIASQAIISGAFSLTRQAVQLGYLPRDARSSTPRRARSARSTSRWSTGCSCRGDDRRW